MSQNFWSQGVHSVYTASLKETSLAFSLQQLGSIGKEALKFLPSDPNPFNKLRNST